MRWFKDWLFAWCDRQEDDCLSGFLLERRTGRIV